jgi:hypothetical protein
MKEWRVIKGIWPGKWQTRCVSMQHVSCNKVYDEFQEGGTKKQMWLGIKMIWVLPGSEGGGGGESRGKGAGGEIAPIMYAHLNKWIKKKMMRRKKMECSWSI